MIPSDFIGQCPTELCYTFLTQVMPAQAPCILLLQREQKGISVHFLMEQVGCFKDGHVLQI